MSFRRIVAQARERSNILFYKMIDENKNELDDRERNEIMNTLAILNKEEEMRYLMSNYGFKVKDIELTRVVRYYNSSRNTDKRRTMEIIKLVLENGGIVKEDYVFAAATSGEFSLTMYLLKMFKQNSRKEIYKMDLMSSAIIGDNVELFKEFFRILGNFSKREKANLFKEMIFSGTGILEYILSDSSEFE
jgi:hypothetical protein